MIKLKEIYNTVEIMHVLNERIKELEKVLRQLLKVSGYSGSLQGYSKSREAALKILAKGDS